MTFSASWSSESTVVTVNMYGYVFPDYWNQAGAKVHPESCSNTAFMGVTLFRVSSAVSRAGAVPVDIRVICYMGPDLERQPLSALRKILNKDL